MNYLEINSHFIVASIGIIFYLGFGHYFPWGGALMRQPGQMLFNYVYGTIGLIAALWFHGGGTSPAHVLFLFAVVGGGATFGFYGLDWLIQRGNKLEKQNQHLEAQLSRLAPLLDEELQNG